MHHLHPYQKILTKLNFFLLLGLVATLFFDQGRYKLLNYLIEIVTLVLIVGCCFNKQNANIRKQVFAGLFVASILLLNQLLSKELQWPKGEIKDLFFMLCVAAAVAVLPNETTLDEKKYRLLAISLLIVVTCVVYLGLIYLKGYPFGPFKNPHFLSLQIVVLANTAIFFSLNFQGIRRVVGLGVLVLSIFTLTLIVSRIAWVALAVSSVIWAGLIFKDKKYVTLIILAFTIAGIYASTLVSYASGPVAALATADNASIVEIWDDERVILWTDTVQMQKDSDLKGWLVGHGLGNFRDAFYAYSSYGGLRKSSVDVEYVFPHNFILEVLYNSGIIGLLSLTIPLIYIVSKTLKRTGNRNYPAILALALLAGVFIHTFFTLPLLTSFPSTSLGLTLGYCLWIARSTTDEVQ